MLPIDWAKDDLDTLLALKPTDAVLLFSTETTRLFFENIVSDRYEDQLRHTKFFCLSENVAAAVPKAFSGNVHISAEPSQAGLLDLLKSY
ncbi:uroporphyrinogen-III synthase [compost metagenome]